MKRQEILYPLNRTHGNSKDNDSNKDISRNDKKNRLGKNKIEPTRKRVLISCRRVSHP